MWFSDAFRSHHADVVSRLHRAADRPGTSDHVAHLLLGLSGIDTPVRRAELDILSDTYTCGKRIVRQKFDYDSLMRRMAGSHGHATSCIFYGFLPFQDFVVI